MEDRYQIRAYQNVSLLSQSHASLMNTNKALNTSNDRNSLAPTPEQSDYFYDEYVDFPDNETNETQPLTTPPPYELGKFSIFIKKKVIYKQFGNVFLIDYFSFLLKIKRSKVRTVVLKGY